MAKVNSEEPYLVPAVVKAVRLLEILRDRGSELTVRELAGLSGLNSSTVHKLMVTLAFCGMAHRDEKTKRYTLSAGLAEFGRVALSGLDLRKAAKPVLSLLTLESGETAVLGLYRDDRLVLADKNEPQEEVRVSPFIGLQIPVTATSHGKAILSALEPAELEEALQREPPRAFTGHSITDLEAFRAEIEAGRERGYAIDREEYHDGVSGVAAPLLSPSGRPVGTISIVGPAFRVSDRLEFLGGLCLKAARELSPRLFSN